MPSGFNHPVGVSRLIWTAVELLAVRPLASLCSTRPLAAGTHGYFRGLGTHGYILGHAGGAGPRPYTDGLEGAGRLVRRGRREESTGRFGMGDLASSQAWSAVLSERNEIE